MKDAGNWNMGAGNTQWNNATPDDIVFRAAGDAAGASAFNTSGAALFAEEHRLLTAEH
ncbi:MAG: hypothetical protein Q8M07_25755 [Prosthecobacter sp.]|nr:hypothetical protein [Prosthecobacter sp.]